MGWFALVLGVAIAAIVAWRLRWLAGRQRRLMLLCRRAWESGPDGKVLTRRAERLPCHLRV